MITHVTYIRIYLYHMLFDSISPFQMPLKGRLRANVFTSFLRIHSLLALLSPLLLAPHERSVLERRGEREDALARSPGGRRSVSLREKRDLRRQCF